MTELVRQTVMFALGWTAFSFSVWLVITLTLMLGAFVMTALAGPVVDPVAVELAVRPQRVQRWIPISLLAVPFVFAFLVVTLIGSPLAVIFAFACILAALLGYIAVALRVADMIAQQAGWKMSPWQLSLLGILTIRVIRLAPFVGGIVQVVWILFGFAAVSAVSWDMFLSWRKRRLPDHVQFRNEDNLIEWSETPLGKAGKGLPDGVSVDDDQNPE